MSRPLLPPRGIFIPTAIIFDREISGGVFQTWVQLRALAWGRQETPVLSMQQMCEITGDSPSTLYGHMTALRNRDALRWRPAYDGTFIVSFPGDLAGALPQSDGSEIEPGCSPDRRSGHPGSRNLENDSRYLENDSRNLEKPYHSSSSYNLSPCTSFNHSKKMHGEDEMEEEEEEKFQKSRKRSRASPEQRWGKRGAMRGTGQGA